MVNNTGEVIIYQTDDGLTHIEVKLEDDTVWLTIDQMAELFGKSRSTINEHILHIFTEGELVESECVRKIGNSDFSTKPTNYYNLDVIISVGYRVKSVRGTQFRKWATERLKEYMIKGFTMQHMDILLRKSFIKGQMQQNLIWDLHHLAEMCRLKKILVLQKIT